MERETCLQRGLSESASVNVLIWEFVDFNLGFGLSCLPEINLGMALNMCFQFNEYVHNIKHGDIDIICTCFK